LVNKTKWRGRAAYSLTNGRVQLTVLPGGGAMAELRCRAGEDAWSPNLLWQAPWPTIDPGQYSVRHSRQYGPAMTGRFLAAFTGNTLCLDYFGPPSAEEERQGLSLHGEAALAQWQVLQTGTGLDMEAHLPAANLYFRRQLKLLGGEPVIYVRETIRNPKPMDHFLQWVQHATFGVPFLQNHASVIALPGTRGKTGSDAYEGKNLLACGREFEWPFAPGKNGKRIDLRRPFIRDGSGFLAAVQFDTDRVWSYIAVLNFRFGLLLGFFFLRSVFPWVTLWEENRAREDAPWKKRTRARGIEFGTTPFPVGRQSAVAAGNLFGQPTLARLPAGGTLTTDYVLFLTSVSPDWREISDVGFDGNAIFVVERTGDCLRLAAKSLSRLGAMFDAGKSRSDVQK
jgi:hypothetical protein